MSRQDAGPGSIEPMATDPRIAPAYRVEIVKFGEESPFMMGYLWAVPNIGDMIEDEDGMELRVEGVKHYAKLQTGGTAAQLMIGNDRAPESIPEQDCHMLLAVSVVFEGYRS